MVYTFHQVSERDVNMMHLKAFLLYPGMCCMVGLIAMLGAALELRLLHKDAHGK